MPANLNALIRYKTIDRCLRDYKYGCSINKLIEKCSEALSENRGRSTEVSERTIRDDLRIMKSDILNFNAPIVFQDGKYYYEEKDYSIFNVTVIEREILKDIIKMILEEKDRFEREKLDCILDKLYDLVGDEIYYEVVPKTSFRIKKSEAIQPEASEDFMMESKAGFTSEDKEDSFMEAPSEKFAGISWNDIFLSLMM